MTIQKYNSFENIIDLISLIDDNVIIKEYINDKKYFIEWKRTKNGQYDYMCKFFVNESNNFIDEITNKYIKDKFEQIQTYIKLNYDNFGQDWTIDFTIINK